MTTFEGEELIVAGTDAGVYLSRPGLITTDADAPAPPLPTAHGLRSPFPNPASGAVTVPFALDRDGRVRLAVYDVLGREVARLADGPLATGAHGLVWDARGVPAGTYFVRLEAGGEAFARPVVILR